MTDAVALAKLHGTADVDRALGTAATVGRFAEGAARARMQQLRDAVGACSRFSYRNTIGKRPSRPRS